MNTQLDSQLSIIGHCPHCGNKWRLVSLVRQCWAYWTLDYPAGAPAFTVAGSEPFCILCGETLALDDVGAVTDNGSLIVVEYPNGLFSPNAN